MTLDEAVKYCEEHECEECIIFTENLDKRTKSEQMAGTLCCENLVTEE